MPIILHATRNSLKDNNSVYYGWPLALIPSSHS